MRNENQQTVPIAGAVAVIRIIVKDVNKVRFNMILRRE